MKFNRKRILSIVITICTIFVSLPLSVSATKNIDLPYVATEDCFAERSDIDQAIVLNEMAQKKGQGIVEIDSLREENSKHFQLEDGSYQVVSYNAPVHRKNAEGKNGMI